jgi:hypothetical protein
VSVRGWRARKSSLVSVIVDERSTWHKARERPDSIAAVRCAWSIGAAIALLALAANSDATPTDPLCVGSYGDAPPRRGAPLRFGVDPGVAGSIGGKQLLSRPDNPARDLAALKALRASGRLLVVRLNRLFWSDGNAGVARFRRLALRYTQAGFEVELQVRYHPARGEVGRIAAWAKYVRHVVDSFGANPGVVAMTITNEGNVQFSPNTSDGYYAGAAAALIRGIEAAGDEARHRGYSQLRFGFTYAYRFVPSHDAAFFSYLGAHGGNGFRRSLGFIGLDFYPGSVYPPGVLAPERDRAELAQAAGVVRRCLAPKAGVGPHVPIWITENGVSSATASERRQAAALAQLVRAANDYSGTYNISDYRWFNLRDSGGPSTLFSTDGLLRADYSGKPSFRAYRRVIAALGARARRLLPGG